MHRFRPEWGTHIPALLKALEISKGSVLELGLGISSTPILHAICEHEGRLLVSCDNDKTFTDMFKKYATPTHQIRLVEDWQEVKPEPCGIVLIDHKPEERRAKDIARFAHFAEILVVHDTEPEHEDLYHMQEIMNSFASRLDYVKPTVHTTLLSNYYDLNKLHYPKY